MPIVSPPPPPSSKGTHQKNPSDVPPAPPFAFSDDAHYDDDHAAFYMDMETPLITHGTRKNRPSQHRQTPSQLATQYAAIRLDEEEAPDNNSEQGGFLASITSSMNNRNNDIASDDRSIISSASSSVSSYRDSLLLPFTDDEGTLDKIGAGLTALAGTGAVIGLVMPKNPNLLDGRWYPYYYVLSSVIGYTYTLLWSSCFYPQVMLNYRRKSTKGLSNDFALLNFMGWSFYAIYLSGMFFSSEIREMYAARFASESSTVQSNDVLFAVHAALLSLVYLVQIVYYRDAKTQQKKGVFTLKLQTWILVLGMGVPTLLVPLLIRGQVLDHSRWLDYFYVLSFFKICCTMTKYSKQVMLNYHRKSTTGWNIWYNFLECTGGSLSMLQIVLDSLAMDDLTGITGNLAKFALGFLTLFFDCIFFTQHYILYAQPRLDEQVAVPPSDRLHIPDVVLSPGNDASSIVTYDDDDDDNSITDPLGR